MSQSTNADRIEQERITQEERRAIYEAFKRRREGIYTDDDLADEIKLITAHK